MVVVPQVRQSRLQWLANDEDRAHDVAQRASERLAADTPGMTVAAEAGDSDPLLAIQDALARFRPTRSSWSHGPRRMQTGSSSVPTGRRSRSTASPSGGRGSPRTARRSSASDSADDDPQLPRTPIGATRVLGQAQLELDARARACRA